MAGDFSQCCRASEQVSIAGDEFHFMKIVFGELAANITLKRSQTKTAAAERRTKATFSGVANRTVAVVKNPWPGE
jgi:hypothetical protein